MVLPVAAVVSGLDGGGSGNIHVVASPPKSKMDQAKSLIMRAWRERWTEVQWGINIRQLADAGEDGSFLSDCILHQALSGPGPNSLVLSYLMYSIHAQIVTTSSVLSSVSKYDAFHKPFCVASLLDLLDSIKEQIIMNDHQGKDDCIQLALALQSVICWLLSCMYSSLETLSDLMSDFPAEAEDSKIVLKCRNLIDYFLNDAYLFNLIQVANKEDNDSFLKIQRMSKEVDTFVDGHHQKDISHVRMLIDKLSAPKAPKSSQKLLPLYKTCDDLQMRTGNPSIQAIVMKAVLLKSSQDIPSIVSELVLVKQLQSVDTPVFYSEVVHSCLMGLVDAFGKKEHELTFMGFTFFQLPSLMSALREKLGDTSDSFVKSLEIYAMNESCLNMADAKLRCCTFQFMLDSFMKVGLVSENDKKNLMTLRTSMTPAAVKLITEAGQAPFIVRAETTLMPLFKTLDGDFQKNQDSIFNVLCDVISNNDKTLNVILTAAATTGKLQNLTSKLIRLNQLSRQVNGEVSKAANTRAMIFDISFLMLCYVVQQHGQKALSSDEQDSFFEEWYKDCMVENHVAKNPDTILNRCENNKVDLLMNQYYQNDSELKTSLVFWHELCVNSVGVVKEILTAWEADSITFADVKRVLDVFRSKICSLPVCISAWLCAHIQVTAEEKCDKAKEILNYFLQPFENPASFDFFKERSILMTQIISRMMTCLQHNDSKTSPGNSPSLYSFESKPVAELYKQSWACMSRRGLIDVETALNLNHLLQMSGPHFFVQNHVEELLRLQHSPEIGQRSSILFGVFHYDLKNCVPALVRVIVPSVLQYWTNESSLMEPQVKALVSLTVDSVLAYYYHATAQKIKEEKKDDNELEPQAKRRKFLEGPTSQKENLSDLHHMLKDLYDEFHNLVHNEFEVTPTIVFILQFLEHLSLKTPSLSLLTSLPHQVVTKLMSLMSDELNPDTLTGLFCLSNKPSRLNCAQALCRLKHQRYANEHYEPRRRSFSPAPGS